MARTAATSIPYRSGPTPRSLTARVGAPSRAIAAFWALGLVLLGASGWAGLRLERTARRWTAGCHAETHASCGSPFADVETRDIADSRRLSLGWLVAREPPLSDAEARAELDTVARHLRCVGANPDRGRMEGTQFVDARVRVRPSRASAFFLLAALMALGAPLLLSDRATLTLDESRDEVRLRRRDRLGRARTVVRSLLELRRATLASDAISTAAYLVFTSGESLSIATPGHGDGGHGRLVDAVNAFVRARGRG